MTSFHSYVMAVERVEQRLRKVTAALDAARIPYAVIGGNAVASWVSTADPHATRSTKDVDLLARKSDAPAIDRVMQSLGFQKDDLRRLLMYLDPDEPSRRSGVHIVWADTLIRPSYAAPSPSVTESERSREGFLVLSLAALVRMKLTSLRPIDQAHIEDLLSLDLIDERVRASLAAPLRERLREVETAFRGRDQNLL